MMKYLLILSLVLLSACSGSKKKVNDILVADGYSNVTVTGAKYFSCSDKDTYSNGFAATKNGFQVVGVVCSGMWFKNSTIRIDKSTRLQHSPEQVADSLLAARRQFLLDSLKRKP